MQRSISFERTVPVDYATAVATLRERSAELVLDDPDASTLVLHAEVAGFDVARTVTVALDPLRELDPRAVALPLSWQAAERPRRFPTFTGMIELSALSQRPPTSQLALVGTVTAPLGVLGNLGEAAGGTELADTVLEALLGQLAARLVRLVADRVAVTAAGAAPSHMSRPRFVPAG